ncbi:MAG: HlyD family efflux transporter periplasmic adaptor subunit, partial [Burkholderiales bacterium]|nr:HlyD family efflux transporter periplasmic adaptor subunit [Burkholderiales bacterium]
MNAPANTTAAPVTTPPAGNPKRRTALTAIAVAVLVIGGGYGIYYWMTGRHSESTDNAYVQANVVQITAQAGGTVTAINADDTDFVKAGQVLVKLDPADARVALDQAEAALAQTVRQTRILFANNSTLQAQIDARAADAARAKADLDKAQDDVNRRQPLVQSGAVGKEEFSHATDTLASAKSAYTAAKSALDAAREQLASNQTQTEGTSVAEHPEVQRAAAKVREAWLAVQRAEVPAPVSGTVARRSVQVGQRVQAGVPLMSVVTLDNPWVDANFKEGQLERLRIGQPATLEADVYGKHVVFHGKVEGLGAGTGAAFSLLPAQNATGNWIKVVQRVPVRIALDPKEVAQNPLRVG